MMGGLVVVVFRVCSDQPRLSSLGFWFVLGAVNELGVPVEAVLRVGDF